MKTKSKLNIKRKSPKKRVRKSPFRAALPNGEFTSSEKEYNEAWINLAKYLEAQLPGFVLTGFDPTFSFIWKGVAIPNLPRGFVVALVERLKGEKIAPVVQKVSKSPVPPYYSWGEALRDFAKSGD